MKRLAVPLSYPGIVQMPGNWVGYYRIRVGDTRFIFWTDMSNGIIYVDHMGPRGSVY